MPKSKKAPSPKRSHREPEDEMYITVKEAADLTSLTERTIHNYIERGRLPTKRIPAGKGRTGGGPVKRFLIRLRKRDVLALMEPGAGLASPE